MNGRMFELVFVFDRHAAADLAAAYAVLVPQRRVRTRTRGGKGNRVKMAPR